VLNSTIFVTFGGNSFAKFSISQNWKRKNPSQNLKKNRIFMNQKTNVAPCKEEHNKGVCHTVALPFYIKKYLKANLEELWKLKLFHHAKNIPIFKKIF